VKGLLTQLEAELIPEKFAVAVERGRELVWRRALRIWWVQNIECKIGFLIGKKDLFSPHIKLTST